MHKALLVGDDIDSPEKKGHGILQYSDYTTIRPFKECIIKTKQKTHYSDQKQHKQLKDQQNNKNKKNWKRSKCMDISKDKQEKAQMRSL